MGKYKYLLKNIGVLTLSQFATKILSFFLVPLYTNVLSSEDYGKYDLISTTIALLMPLLTINIIDATLRFSLDKKEDVKSVFTISLKYSGIGILLCTALLSINFLLGVFPVSIEETIFLYILFILTVVNNLFIYFARGIDKISAVAASSALCSFVMILLNIIFLIPLNMGLTGYFLASILGMLAQLIFLLISVKAWRYIDFSKISFSLQKKMLSYSSPLIVNAVSWWVNNASDRYIVTFLCGVSANGIYAVGYKIPSIINVFQTIFNQAWVLSAVKDFDKNDTNGFFSRTYNLYNFGMTFICSLIIASTRILAYFLYAKDFYFAWQYVPMLTIAIVFGAISGYIGGILSAVKDTKKFAITTGIGAIVNIILNIVLVYFIGPVGAAISTAFSFFLVWALRVKLLKKHISIKLHLVKDLLAYNILVLQTIALFVFYNGINIYSILCQLILIITLVILMKDEVNLVIQSIKTHIKR